MEWFAALMIIIIVAFFVGNAARKNKLTPGQPEGCSCIWFQNEEGPYRALADVKCQHHGRGN